MTTTNLEFTNKEWESLERLREANGADRNQVVTTNNDDNTRRTQQQTALTNNNKEQ